MSACEVRSQTHLYSAPLVNSHGKPWGVKSSRVRFAVAQRPRGALVFVHGFRGKSEATWSRFPELLSCGHSAVCKAAEYDAYYYGYDSRPSVVASSAALGKFINELATTPSKEIINPSLGSAFGNTARGYRWCDNAFQYERIIVCAHSMGALVVRRALLNLFLARGSQMSPWSSKVQLLLYAPAHLGANILPLVSMVLGGIGVVFHAVRIDGKIGEAALRARFHSLNDLDRNSTTIQQLITDTTTILLSNPAAKRWLQATVVDGEYDGIVQHGRFVEDDVPPVVVPDADHFSVCKPTSFSDEAITTLLSFL
jgi:hypothetical protein